MEQPIKKDEKKEKKVACDLSFIREKGQQLLRIKILPELEELFKNDQITTSQVYKTGSKQALKSYGLSTKLSQMTDMYNQTRKSNPSITLQNYGHDFYRNGLTNFSILRTVGISEGIEINVDNLILDAELKTWLNSLALFLKFLSENFVHRREIRVMMTIEI